MAIPNLPAPLLSDDLQAMIGFAIVDGAFQELLLSNPRRALATFGLSARDYKAAIAIHGAESLAEYAVRLEQRLARVDETGRVVVRRDKPARQNRLRAAS